MDEELRELRFQLAEERRKRQEEEEQARAAQHRREAAAERARAEQQQHQREEEQHRRERVEYVLAQAREQDLASFLQGCHELSRLIMPVNKLWLASTGATTNQTGHLYPQTILPWNDFPSQQLSIWERLPRGSSAWTSQVYPAATNLDFLRRKIDPIGSEEQLRFLERLLVEDMVKTMFEEMEKHDELEEDLRTIGRISFKNQAGFREADLSSLNASSHTVRLPRRAVLRCKDGAAMPVVAIEYIPPYKLTIHEICTGLQGEIRPGTDIIGCEDDNFDFLCKYLMATVLAQLFSYMIDKGVRYGYVSTGEAYVFLHIPTDPTMLYYSVNVPRQDFEQDADNRLQRTAVSQIFAFVQQALRDEPPDQAWIAAARSGLSRWKVEIIDVLKKIPETERKSRDYSAYKPGRWVPSNPTPRIVPRRRCKDGLMTPQGGESDPDGGSENEGGGSPSMYRETRSRTAKTRGLSKQAGAIKSAQSRGNTNGSVVNGQSIESRAYCTHDCLRGMCQGLPLDPHCPNVTAHGRRHIPPGRFLELVRQQLTGDRGKNADCCALYLHGSRGALLKVRLTSYGYTLVAKGFARQSFQHFQNEKRIYDRLEPLQGRYVPVCCDVIELEIPYYYDGVELKHLLLMSWAGESMVRIMRDDSSAMERSETLLQEGMEALRAIHQRAVLHHDVEPRNMLYNLESRQLMLVDFERSEICDRQTLGELSPNHKRKDYDDRRGKAETDPFTKEASKAEFMIRKTWPSRC